MHIRAELASALSGGLRNTRPSRGIRGGVLREFARIHHPALVGRMRGAYADMKLQIAVRGGTILAMLGLGLYINGYFGRPTPPPAEPIISTPMIKTGPSALPIATKEQLSALGSAMPPPARSVRLANRDPEEIIESGHRADMEQRLKRLEDEAFYTEMRR